MKSINNIDEEIVFSEYGNAWPMIYEKELALLVKIIPENDLIDIQHIGSTSVPGAYAKPIIDIMVGLKLLFINEELHRILEKNRYSGFGEAGVKNRLYYRKRDIVNINLAIVKWGDEIWKNNIILREYLRTHPDEVQNYSKRKHEIQNAGINTLLKYSDEKNEYMIKLLKRALHGNSI